MRVRPTFSWDQDTDRPRGVPHGTPWGTTHSAWPSVNSPRSALSTGAAASDRPPPAETACSRERCRSSASAQHQDHPRGSPLFNSICAFTSPIGAMNMVIAASTRGGLPRGFPPSTNRRLPAGKRPNPLHDLPHHRPLRDPKSSIIIQYGRPSIERPLSRCRRRALLHRTPSRAGFQGSNPPAR
jgi:hypothetical protein